MECRLAVDWREWFLLRTMGYTLIAKSVGLALGARRRENEAGPIKRRFWKKRKRKWRRRRCFRLDAFYIYKYIYSCWWWSITSAPFSRPFVWSPPPSFLMLSVMSTSIPCRSTLCIRVPHGSLQLIYTVSYKFFGRFQYYSLTSGQKTTQDIAIVS